MYFPEKYNELKAKGYTQEPHKVPMYRILFAITRLRDQQKLATTARIAEEIGKYQGYVTCLIDVYWKWDYVKKKQIRTAHNKYRSAGKATFHWDLTASGKRKLQRLREEFGEMVMVSDTT